MERYKIFQILSGSKNNGVRPILQVKYGLKIFFYCYSLIYIKELKLLENTYSKLKLWFIFCCKDVTMGHFFFYKIEGILLNKSL